MSEDHEEKDCRACGWSVFVSPDKFLCLHDLETKNDLKPCSFFRPELATHDEVVERISHVISDKLNLPQFVKRKLVFKMHMPDVLINIDGTDEGWLAIEYVHEFESFKRDLGGALMIKLFSEIIRIKGKINVVLVLNPKILGSAILRRHWHFTREKIKEMASKIPIEIVFLDDFMDWLKDKIRERMKRRLESL